MSKTDSKQPEPSNEAGFAGAHGSATCGTFTVDSPRGYKRVSCSCGRAVVRQPWMHELAWKLVQEHFTIDHAGKSPTDQAQRSALGGK